MDNLKQKGTSAFAWDFSGKLAMHGVGFIVSIFLARLLDPSDFGLLAMVMVFIGIASIFSDVGLGSALIQRRRVLPIHYSSVFYFNISVGSVLAFMTFMFAPLLASFYENDALIPLTQVISVSFLINAFSSVQRTRLRKELNYALLTKISFATSLIGGLVGISLAFSGAGVWSLVIQSLIQGVVFNILIWLTSRWVPGFAFSLKALMQLWSFGFRMFLSGLLDAIFTRLDILIIGKLFEPATLGYYNRAQSLDKLVIKYSSGSIMAVLFPILSKIKNDLPRFRKIILESLGIIVFVVFFMLGGLYLTSNELILMLFGEKWFQSVSYFKILILSGFAYPVSALLVNVLSSRGNSKDFLKLEIYKKVIFGTNLAVGFIWGIEGYLYGLFLAWVLAVFVNIVFASKEIDIAVIKFIKPIVIQGLIVIFIVKSIEFSLASIELGMFDLFLIKSIMFSVGYILINWMFRVKSYYCFTGYLMPLLNRSNRTSRVSHD